MKNCLTARTTKDVFANCSISGFSLPVYVENGTNNTAFTGAMLDFTKCRIKATLIGRGAPIEIIPNLVLRNLLHLTQLEKNDFDFFREDDFQLTKAHGASNVAIARIPLSVDFGSVINLQGNEKLICEITIDDGFFTSQMNQSTSYLQFDKIEGIGVEQFTPIFMSEVIDTSQDNQSFRLGDNVTRIVVANYDKTGFLTADQVVTNLELTTDRYNRNDTALEIYTKQLEYYATVAEAESRLQNYIIHSGPELDKVNLNLTMTSSNVTASKNYVLWRKFVSSANLVRRAANMASKHFAKDMAKVGLSVPASNAAAFNS